MVRLRKGLAWGVEVRGGGGDGDGERGKGLGGYHWEVGGEYSGGGGGGVSSACCAPSSAEVSGVPLSL